MAKAKSNSKAESNRKPDTVHVGLLIDETGSMMGNEQAVVGGVNEFVEKLRKQEADSKVRATLAMFDLHGGEPVVRMKYTSIPIDEVDSLGAGDYAPRGATPLNDAVVGTIRKMQKKVKKEDRAILVILTDGLENSSETSTDEVRKLINRKEKAGWEFIYLGANQDAWAAAQSLGVVAPGRSFDYQASPAGTADALALSADRVQSFRASRSAYEVEAEQLGRRSKDSR